MHIYVARIHKTILNVRVSITFRGIRSNGEFYGDAVVFSDNIDAFPFRPGAFHGVLDANTCNFIFDLINEIYRCMGSKFTVRPNGKILGILGKGPITNGREIVYLSIPACNENAAVDELLVRLFDKLTEVAIKTLGSIT